MSKGSLATWYRNNHKANASTNGKVYLFNDEFTNFLDVEIGVKTILLLTRLGYEVLIPRHLESGRTYFSKGLIRRGAEIAKMNVNVLSGLISDKTPLIGIEPSAILSFRDEYPDLVGKELKDKARELARNCLMVDEFLDREMQAGRIDRNMFSDSEKMIQYHGHCQQKSIASVRSTMNILQWPRNYKVKQIPSGCCGMAGSFGYEKEHYELSMKIGELVLFPEVRKHKGKSTIVASGTSCRHQIMDGTGEHALHPVEILFDALK
jgi:Fe-S oxidoreductase